MDCTTSTRDLVRLKSACTSHHIISSAAVSYGGSCVSDSDGSIQPAVNRVNLFAKAGLQWVPGSPEYELQYVRIDLPESRNDLDPPAPRYMFLLFMSTTLS